MQEDVGGSIRDTGRGRKRAGGGSSLGWGRKNVPNGMEDGGVRNAYSR